MKSLNNFDDGRREGNLNWTAKNGYEECECGGIIVSDGEWNGETKDGVGHSIVHYRCEDCCKWATYDLFGG